MTFLNILGENLKNIYIYIIYNWKNMRLDNAYQNFIKKNYKF